MDWPTANAWIEQHFGVLFAAALAWVVFVGVVQASLRRRRGLPVFRPDYSDALFVETWTTVGASWIGTANSCAWVVFTPSLLHIGMHFPFSVGVPMWMARLFGLEAKIPLERIVRVESDSRLLVGPMVAIAWREDGSTRTTSVRVGKESAFIERLKSAARSRGAAL